MGPSGFSRPIANEQGGGWYPLMAVQGAMKWLPARLSTSSFTCIRRKLKETLDPLGD